MPDELKVLLNQEEGAIKKQFKIHAIPLKNNVEEIMTTYLEHVRTKDNGTINPNELAEINLMAEGLIEYFNFYLGRCVLYDREKVQHTEMLSRFRGVKMSHIYGSFHLLRLFTIVIPLARQSELPYDERRKYVKHLNDFLRYLCEQSDALFRRVPFLPNPHYK